ncbi:protein kinase domain-containing protein [Dactylosporangium sp. CA-139114]|uniref:protein kinase domain-containing protein n=1 Tax=Dactylosporangium sp. CA-139114 TaxID=3239931 RepID=UPI003D963805
MLADALLNDRYQVARLPFAHTGMSEVWPAQDTLLGRRVVVKAVGSATDVNLMRRFRREARLTAQLNHPGVPAVYDLGQHEGRLYLVLQYIDGITLDDLIAEHGPMPVAWVAAIGAQIASVLMAARPSGLVHRDLKPSNIMVEPSGTVKVIDFGIAAIRGDQRYSRITRTGESVGTFGYMAPEQVFDHAIDQRTDLYGLGGTLHYLLTAEPPFDDDITAVLVHRQLQEPPPRPSEHRSDVPVAIDDLIHALLAAAPDDRPATAEEVYDVLAAHAGPPPRLPRVIAEGVDPAFAYVSAATGRHTSDDDTAAGTPPRESDLQYTTAEAQQRIEQGEYRAAARLWRQLAARHRDEHGPAHPLVIDCMVQVARAHVALREPERARRILDRLLQDRLQAADPDDPVIRQLRDELARVPLPN